MRTRHLEYTRTPNLGCHAAIAYVHPERGVCLRPSKPLTGFRKAWCLTTRIQTPDGIHIHTDWFRQERHARMWLETVTR